MTGRATAEEREELRRWWDLRDEAPLAGSIAERELIAAVERIVAAHVDAALAEVERRLDAAFSGDDYDENANEAAQERELSWFHWLATSTISDYRAEVSS